MRCLAWLPIFPSRREFPALFLTHSVPDNKQAEREGGVPPQEPYVRRQFTPKTTEIKRGRRVPSRPCHPPKSYRAYDPRHA